jgi:hypothetical protein
MPTSLSSKRVQSNDRLIEEFGSALHLGVAGAHAFMAYANWRRRYYGWTLFHALAGSADLVAGIRHALDASKIL